MKRSIKLVFYYFIYQLLFTALTSIPAAIRAVSSGVAPEDMANQLEKASGETLGLAMILSGLAMLWHLIHFRYVRFNKATWTEVPFRTIALSIPFIVAVIFASNILNEFLDLPNHLQEAFIGMSRTIFGFISIAIMAPLIEELLFRGAIEGHLLRQGKSPHIAILLSALIFGIIHFNPAQILFAFFLGVVFGWLYYRTGSVVPGMVGHCLNNAGASLFMAFSSDEDANKTTIETIGALPTYVLLAVAVVVAVGMFLYLSKHLSQPAIPAETTEEQPAAF